MLDAIDVPFDASKYAFRTNFDGLTITNDAASARLKDAKNNFQSALINFESSDKKARDIYKDEKDDGLTTDSFGTWVVQNVSSCKAFEFSSRLEWSCISNSQPIVPPMAWGEKSAAGPRCQFDSSCYECLWGSIPAKTPK